MTTKSRKPKNNAEHIISIQTDNTIIVIFYVKSGVQNPGLKILTPEQFEIAGQGDIKDAPTSEFHCSLETLLKIFDEIKNPLGISHQNYKEIISVEVGKYQQNYEKPRILCFLTTKNDFILQAFRDNLNKTNRRKIKKQYVN